jgi:hypothetical protein
MANDEDRHRNCDHDGISGFPHCKAVDVVQQAVSTTAMLDALTTVSTALRSLGKEEIARVLVATMIMTGVVSEVEEKMELL